MRRRQRQFCSTSLALALTPRCLDRAAVLGEPRDLARESADEEPLLRAAERLGPILGAAALTLETDGKVLAWKAPHGATADAREHRFSAVGPAGQPIGTLALHLPAADVGDLGFLVESLCRLMARQPKGLPATTCR